MITAENMLRVGIVSAVNADKKQVRVIFPESNDLVSDWLYVLQRSDETDSQGGHRHTDSVGGSTSYGGGHTHKIAGWMPKVKDRVLCAMMCGEETDGFVLGAIP